MEFVDLVSKGCLSPALSVQKAAGSCLVCATLSCSSTDVYVLRMLPLRRGMMRWLDGLMLGCGLPPQPPRARTTHPEPPCMKYALLTQPRRCWVAG